MTTRTGYKVVGAAGKELGHWCDTPEEAEAELRFFTRHDVGEGPYTIRTITVSENTAP